MTKPKENKANSRRDFARKITAGVSLLGAVTSAESEVPAFAKPKKKMLQHGGADYHVVMAGPDRGGKAKAVATKKNF